MTTQTLMKKYVIKGEEDQAKLARPPKKLLSHAYLELTGLMLTFCSQRPLYQRFLKGHYHYLIDPKEIVRWG